MPCRQDPRRCDDENDCSACACVCAWSGRPIQGWTLDAPRVLDHLDHSIYQRQRQREKKEKTRMVKTARVFSLSPFASQLWGGAALCLALPSESSLAPSNLRPQKGKKYSPSSRKSPSLCSWTGHGGLLARCGPDM